MANAKQCDICGKYYTVSDINDSFIEECRNTSMVRILRRVADSPCRVKHDVMHFDSCDGCLQDVLDYILTKQASRKMEE